MMPESRTHDKRHFLPLERNAMLLHMKRTTLQLDPALLSELKKRAAQEGRTLTEVIERTLRAGLAAQGTLKRARVSLPSYDLGPFLADPARPAEDE
jgi:hypothetical protein